MKYSLYFHYPFAPRIKTVACPLRYKILYVKLHKFLPLLQCRSKVFENKCLRVTPRVINYGVRGQKGQFPRRIYIMSRCRKVRGNCAPKVVCKPFHVRRQNVCGFVGGYSLCEQMTRYLLDFGIKVDLRPQLK